MVEYGVANAEVTGSNPVSRSKGWKMFECTAFYDPRPVTKDWECTPEELHRRRQQKYDELFGSDAELARHQSFKLDEAGSSPVAPTKEV